MLDKGFNFKQAHSMNSERHTTYMRFSLLLHLDGIHLQYRIERMRDVEAMLLYQF